MAIRHVFLDDGGVINDNALRAPQWRRLVAEFFAPRLGGTRAAWEEANRLAFEEVWERFQRRFVSWDDQRSSYVTELRSYDADWVVTMCLHAEVEAPGSENDCATLGRVARDWIMPQVRAGFPDVSIAVPELARTYTLYTASGGASFELALSLKPLGIRHLFQRLYGPDLVNFPKTGPEYYRRVFAHAGVEPVDCVVVDDSRSVLDWAREAGAQTVLMSHGPEDTGSDAVVSSLTELPGAIRRLDPDAGGRDHVHR